MELSQILVNGVVSDGTVPVTDSSVLRGDGCFEVLKAYSGRVFALEGHLDRLENSASRLQIFPIAMPYRSGSTRWPSRWAIVQCV